MSIEVSRQLERFLFTFGLGKHTPNPHEGGGNKFHCFIPEMPGINSDYYTATTTQVNKSLPNPEMWEGLFWNLIFVLT